MEDAHRSDANLRKSPGHEADLLRKSENHLTNLYTAIHQLACAMNYLAKRNVARLLGDPSDIEG